MRPSQLLYWNISDYGKNLSLFYVYYICEGGVADFYVIGDRHGYSLQKSSDHVYLALNFSGCNLSYCGMNHEVETLSITYSHVCSVLIPSCGYGFFTL